MAITFTDGVASSSPAPQATLALSTLLPKLSITVAACPGNVKTLALKLAARDFCRDTEIWRETLSTTTTADEDEYDITDLHTYDALIQRVRLVTLDDTDLVDSAWSVSEVGTLTLDTAPEETGDTLAIEVVFMPLEICTDYPGWLLDKWAEAIVARALAILKAQPQKPWSDPAAVPALDREYLYLCGRAKATLASERKSGDFGMSVPAFA